MLFRSFPVTILVAHQIQAQFGKEGLDRFLSYAIRNSSIVKYGALAVSTSAHIYSEAETVRILADIYDDVAYVGYGSLGEGNIVRRDGCVESKFNLLWQCLLLLKFTVTLDLCDKRLLIRQMRAQLLHDSMA